MRGTRNGHAAAAALSLFGELQVDLAVVSGDQAVVEVVVLDLQEDGVAVQVRAVLEEVHTFRGDEDAVAVDQLHRDETGEEKHTQETASYQLPGGRGAHIVYGSKSTDMCVIKNTLVKGEVLIQLLY